MLPFSVGCTAIDGTTMPGRAAPIGTVTAQNAPGLSQYVWSVGSTVPVTGTMRVVGSAASATSVILPVNERALSLSWIVTGMSGLRRGASCSVTWTRTSIGSFCKIVASTAPGCRYWPWLTVRVCTTPAIGARVAELARLREPLMIEDRGLLRALLLRG